MTAVLNISCTASQSEPAIQLGRRKNPFGKNPSRVSRERSGTDQETACSVALRPANESCSWTSSSPVPWATITEGAAQSGDANVRIRIDPNAGAARSAILIIAGERFTLTQEASRK